MLNFLRRMNPAAPLFELLDLWSQHEMRKVAWRALESQCPGRTHTPAEWDAMADKFISEMNGNKADKRS